MSVIAPPSSTGEMSSVDVSEFETSFDRQAQQGLAMNAVSATAISKVALNRKRVSLINNVFSVQLKENPITEQKNSGRCWMFAALNTFRSGTQFKLGLETKFEFSQNHTMFWDKFEKANYFLENILRTLKEPVGSRLLDWLLGSPVADGGQWDMFVNLVEKYGVVPKSVMPETESSSKTGELNYHLTTQLRGFACELRGLHESGMTIESLRATKKSQMSQVYTILAIHLGQPPNAFDWQWRNKEDEFHRELGLTPKSFYDKFVGEDLGQRICLIHDPRPGHKFNQLYTVKFLGNVEGGRPTLYLNVELEVVKAAAVAQLQANESVWFGCDVGKFLERELGVMDLDLFDFDSVYGAYPQMSKADRLQYGQSLMTHAMVFTGVDLDADGTPVKWRVENSWGDKHGDKGYFQMTDDWFSEYTYEVVVDQKYIPKASLHALDTKPIELDPWDPMGSLAAF